MNKISINEVLKKENFDALIDNKVESKTKQKRDIRKRYHKGLTKIVFETQNGPLEGFVITEPTYTTFKNE